MNPREHQIEGAYWALSTIRSFGLAYLSWKERTGKTLTALLTVEYSKMNSCLVVTKKKAISGWEETLKEWKHVKRYTVINYESLHKLNPSDYDFIILDESHHAISSIGRPSKTWKTVKMFTKGKPILFLSATPYAEHVGLIYHQLKLSDWTPFKEVNFFRWYDRYGIPNMTRTPYGLQDQRNRYHTEDVLTKVDHLFNFKTRQDVGIEHEPTVNLIKVKPKASTIKLLVDWVEDRVITVNGHELLGDSDPKLRSVHYQIEGGTIKIDDKLSIRIGNNEKVDYITRTYEAGTYAVMAHFIAEREYLLGALPAGTRILSSDGDAEGVDLHRVQKLIVYSMSFKTSKHTQRVARQANHNREHPIVVDVLVMDSPGIGAAVYDSVAVKEENFIKSSYERSLK